MPLDIEDLGVSHLQQKNIIRRKEEKNKLESFVIDLVSSLNKQSEKGEIIKKSWNKLIRKLSQEHSITPGVVQLNYTYRLLLNDSIIERCIEFEKWCIAKTVRVNSGVVVITVLTSPYPEDEFGVPQDFSCEYDCYYCPKEPDQPRSYLKNEPAVRRANRWNFDAIHNLMIDLLH